MNHEKGTIREKYPATGNFNSASKICQKIIHYLTDKIEFNLSLNSILLFGL
jgi:hypothetical protein